MTIQVVKKMKMKLIKYNSQIKNYKSRLIDYLIKYLRVIMVFLGLVIYFIYLKSVLVTLFCFIFFIISIIRGCVWSRIEIIEINKFDTKLRIEYQNYNEILTYECDIHELDIKISPLLTNERLFKLILNSGNNKITQYPSNIWSTTIMEKLIKEIRK